MDEILDVTLLIAETCERLGIPYAVGGSLASSLHGFPRATDDVDIVAVLREPTMHQFIAAIRDQFYLDTDAISDAVAQRSSFNVIHLGTYFKVDIFVSKDDEAGTFQMQRRQRFALPAPHSREIVLASPEDVIAQKLAWFVLGEQVSERQWRDVIGVLKVSGPRLDWAYARRVATILGVETLLERAIEEAGRD